MKLISALLTFVAFVSTTFSMPSKQVKAAGIPDDKTMASPTNHRIKTVSNFCINEFVTSFDKLKELSQDNKKPANVILYINKDGYLTDDKGVSLNKTYHSSCSTYIKDTMIPCFYIKDLDTEAAFATYWKASWKRWDMTIVSDNPEVLLQARKDLPVLRGILDYSKASKTSADFPAMIKETHTARANTLLISKDLACFDTFRYFQARFKTVWVDDRDASDLEVLNHVTKGADGIFSNSYQDTVEALSCLNDTVYNKANYNRPIFNIAHRGLPKTNYENSLEGCIEAYEKGATHIEIDIQVTKDDKLALMHDDTMARTTNIEDVIKHDGSISQFTEEELKDFVIDSTLTVKKKGDGVHIPMLNEIFNEFKGKDLVIVVEIKTANSKCPELLKSYIEAADIADQVVVISFYQNQLLKMRDVMPGIPTADLNNHNINTFSESSLSTLNSYNMIGDLNFGCYSTTLSRYFSDRGYASFYWTSETLASVFDGIAKGIVGETNNVADEVGELPYSIKTQENLQLSKDQLIGDFTTTGTTVLYNKTDGKEIECSVLSSKDCGEYYEVIFQGKFSSGTSTPKLVGTFFSEVTRVKKYKEPIIIPEENKGCGGSITASLSFLAFGLIGIVLLIKRREEVNL